MCQKAKRKVEIQGGNQEMPLKDPVCIRCLWKFEKDEKFNNWIKVALNLLPFDLCWNAYKKGWSGFFLLVILMYLYGLSSTGHLVDAYNFMIGLKPHPLRSKVVNNNQCSDHSSEQSTCSTLKLLLLLSENQRSRDTQLIPGCHSTLCNFFQEIRSNREVSFGREASFKMLFASVTNSSLGIKTAGR